MSKESLEYACSTMTNLGPLIIAKTTGARRKCFYVTITGFIFPKFSEKLFFREMKISIFIFFGLAHITLYLHGGVRESSCLDFSDCVCTLLPFDDHLCAIELLSRWKLFKE